MTSVISEFYGMTILMSGDSLETKPHFTVMCEGEFTKIDISNCKILDGNLDSDGYEIIRDWWKLHHNTLKTNWDYLSKNIPLRKIEPIL